MKTFKKSVFGLGAVIYIVSLIVSGAVALAATPTVNYYLTPASATITNNQNLVLQVWENSGSDTISTLQVNMNFPSAGLNMTNVSYTGSQFDGGNSGSEGSAGPGTIQMTRYYTRKDVNGTTTYGVTGAQLVATVYFTVTATSGTQTVSFDNSSAAWTPPSNLNDPNSVVKANITSQPGSYSFASSAPPPTGGGGSGGGSGGGASSSSSSTSSTKNTSPAPASTAKNTTYKSNSGQLSISGISVDNIGNTSATVNWTTSAAATSEVDYGLAADQMSFVASNSNPSTSHSLALSSDNLKPGKTYYFVVKSADSAGDIVASSTLTFETTGGKSAASPASKNVGAAIAAVAGIAIIAIAGAVIIRRMHQRALANQELASHIATTPGTSVINGQVTITPDPKLPPDHTNPPKT